MTWMRWTVATVAAATLIGAVYGQTAPKTPPKPALSEAQVAAIHKAIPESAPAKPKQARKVLLYDHCNGFNHASAIAAGRLAFAQIASKTGAFELTASNDLENFEADNLRQFDAIIFNNTTGELFTGKALAALKTPPADQDEAARMTARLRANLVEFVKAGKGVMGIHAATDCSYTWKEWGQIMGGYFDGHPWNQMVAIRNDDPTHPVNAAFEGKSFKIKDEIYQFGPRGPDKWDAYSRDTHRVLMSLNIGDGPDKTPDKGKRADKDHGISWVKTFGKGRVFYCALGHDASVFTNPAVLKHYLAGLQYALGDLEADATPSAKLPK